MGHTPLCVTTFLCLILPGTRTENTFDGNSDKGESVFLLAVKEKAVPGVYQGKTYGVCFVDTCIGTFHVCGRFVYSSVEMTSML